MGEANSLKHLNSPVATSRKESDTTDFTFTFTFPGGASGKEPACQCQSCKKCGFDPWVRKIPWRKKWQPTPVFLTEEAHRGAWQAIVHRVAKSQMWLKQLSRHIRIQFSSVQFSRSFMSDTLPPHELQHSRPPCPPPTPRVYSNSCPLNQWCHPNISSSVISFSSCPQSLPASGSFPWVNYSHEVAKVLEFQLQHQSFQWIFRTDFL